MHIFMAGLVALLCLLVGLSAAMGEENVTSPEERIASLEENLTIMQRQVDVALKRTTSLIERAESLERAIGELNASLMRLRDFASPSAPQKFYIESIRRDASGNYTVTLRWKANPREERVTRYTVWYARVGEEYAFAESVNDTGKVSHKARVSGFEGGEQIVFKVFGQNEAGQGDPSYREARIQAQFPFLMSRLRLLGAAVALVVVAGGLAWYLQRRKS
jgi:hypothetical protein